jgi:foldase protein PrsA
MTRSIAALGAVFLVSVAVAACGSSNSVPGNAVASVNGVPITMDTFNHWLQIAANSSQQSNTGSAIHQAAPVPPDYTACVTALKQQLAALLKGKATPSQAQLKAQCAQEYQSYLQQVMQFLVSAEWVLGEAKKQGINVTDKQVIQQFQMIKKQQFPTDAAYQAFLKQSGETEADLLLRVKLELISTKLRAKATAANAKVTDQQVANYYNQHKSSFGSPESRNVNIILTKTPQQAAAALAAVKGGTPFATEAKKSSIDVASKNQGGALTNVVRGQEEQALDQAIFAAPVNQLAGPVKTPFGYYVYQVTKVNPGTQKTLAQVSPTIKAQLAAQNQQTSLTTFVNGFTKRWTKITNCRTGFVVSDCSNYKAPKTGATGATGPTGG